jgi:hypothetical protein
MDSIYVAEVDFYIAQSVQPLGKAQAWMYSADAYILSQTPPRLPLAVHLLKQLCEPTAVTAMESSEGAVTPSGLSNDLCPTCEQKFLTKPRPASGYYTPENAGRMYQEVF